MYYIDPEPYTTDSTYNNKYYEGLNIIVVTANDYATKIGYDILQNGGLFLMQLFPYK